MTTWFVSRHAGSTAWLGQQGLTVDRPLSHWDDAATAAVSPGDVVIGTLPMALAAAVCERGARYLHLTIDLPAPLRGAELDAAALLQHGARLEEFRVQRVYRPAVPDDSINPGQR